MIKILGPKCSTCCMLTSVWGIIMMLCLGGAYKLRSPALYKDIPIDFKNAALASNQKEVFAAYDSSGTNCFIAAGLYVLVLFFSLWQWKVNKSLQTYTVR
ncbi:ribonuclease kappa-B [Ciona intestinalis]